MEKKEDVDYAKDLGISVTVDKSSYEQTGKVTFKIVVKNNGEGIFYQCHRGGRDHGQPGDLRCAHARRKGY